MCGIITSSQAPGDLILLLENGMDFVVWDINICDNWLTHRVKSNHPYTINEDAMI